MNGLQLAHLLSMDSYTTRFFQGFAMRDTKHFPMPITYPALYILNTDTKQGDGEHWCVAVYDAGKLEFFDSFGLHPFMYGFHTVLDSKVYKSFVYNEYRFQCFGSHVCGHHCFFYAYHRARGMSMRQIQAMYDKENDRKNDAMVLDFVLKYGKSYYPK